MTAKIIKLDEYLEQYKWNIAKSIAHVMGLNPDDPNEVKRADQMIADAAEKKFAGDVNELQINLVAALEVKDDEAVKDLLQIQEQEWTEEAFNGVDIAEGYNFRCQMANEMAKNQFMDWLEESGVDYLIDGDGRFAIKCPDRRSHYHISRKVDHFSNKWDRGPVQKTVDPAARVKGLTDIARDNGLYDNVTEIAGSHPVYSPGTGKGIETGIGPSMFPADKKKKHRYLDDDPRGKVREDTDLPDDTDGARAVMQQFGGLSDKVRMRPDPSVAFVWLVVDDGKQQAWIVYIKEEDAEQIDDYAGTVSKYFDKPGQTVWEGITEGKKKTPKQREKEARKKLDDPEAQAKAASGQEDPAKKLKDPQYQHRVIPDKKKADSKKEARKKVDTSESAQIEEGVLGMTNLPTVARMKELAGLEASQPESITTVEIVPVENVSCEDGALDLATSRLNDVFKIYDMLDTCQKEEFRLRLINFLMKGGGHLRESNELLKELEVTQPTGQLTTKDRVQLAQILRKYWRGMTIDVDNWKDKTTKLAPLEQVIILLRKLEQRIGQGMT